MRSVLPSDALHDILQRQHALATRSGAPFSLVTFPGRGNALAAETASQLAGALKRRTRFTDDIGWFEDQRIGVILPDTDTNGAKCFADSVLGMLDLREPLTTYEVSTFPGNEKRKTPLPVAAEPHDGTMSAGRRAPARRATG